MEEIKKMKTYESTKNHIGKCYRATVFYGENVRKWVVTFYTPWGYDYDERGTNGTGCKLYDTEKQASAAAKRYAKKHSREPDLCDIMCG